MTIVSEPALSGPRHRAPESPADPRAAATDDRRGRHAAPEWDGERFDPDLDQDLLDWLGFSAGV